MSDVPGQLDPLDASGETRAMAQAAAATAQHDSSQAAESEIYRARRLRQLKLSLITSALVRPVSFILPLVTVPLFYHYLGGKHRYGLYESIGAMAMYIGIANAGLTLGLVNHLTECQVRDDRELARRYTSSLTPALIALMLVGLLILSAITPLIPWSRWFETSDPGTVREIAWSFWLTGLLTLLGFVAGIPSAIYTAYQETHLNNLWDGAAKIASLIACVALLLVPGWGIIGVILALSGVQTLVRLVNTVDLFRREKRSLMPSLRLFDWRLLRSMMSANILLFALQMSSVLLFQSDKLIIGIGLKPDDVAGYAILGRVFMTAYGVYMMVLTPLWPASGEAIRRGDIAWVKRSLRYSMLLGCGMMLCVGIVLFFFTDAALRRIPGASGLTISRSLIAAYSVTFILRAWVDCRSIILNSVHVLAPQIVFYTGHALLNLVVAIVVVRRWGVEGVAWSTALTALVTSAWGYPWLIRRYIVSRENAPQTREST